MILIQIAFNCQNTERWKIWRVRAKVNMVEVLPNFLGLKFGAKFSENFISSKRNRFSEESLKISDLAWISNVAQHCLRCEKFIVFSKVIKIRLNLPYQNLGGGGRSYLLLIGLSRVGVTFPNWIHLASGLCGPSGRYNRTVWCPMLALDFSYRLWAFAEIRF